MKSVTQHSQKKCVVGGGPWVPEEFLYLIRKRREREREKGTTYVG